MAQNQPYQHQHGYVDTAFLKAAAEFSTDRKQQVYRQMNVQPGQRVLDVGCGPGTDTTRWRSWLAQAGTSSA